MVVTEERTTGAPLFTLGGSRQAASVGAQAWLIKHGDGHLGTYARTSSPTLHVVVNVDVPATEQNNCREAFVEDTVIERGRSSIRIAGVEAMGPMRGCHTLGLRAHMGCRRETREAHVGQQWPVM